MLEKLLQEIVGIVVGKNSEAIVSLLNTKKHANEFTLAKKLEITINQTRNILYKISDYGLVSSIRKRDKKKGWYTYYWKFEILKCLEFLKNLLMERKKEIEQDLEIRKSKIFYSCDLCAIEHSEDEALLMDFTCDECGELFTTKDNSKLIREYKRQLSKINERLGLIEIEIEIEQAKLEKKKQTVLRKEQKDKDLKKEEARLKRAAKREEREKEKKKLAKTSKKKVVKKKKSTKKKVVKKKVVKKKIVTPSVPLKGKKKVVKKKVIKKKVAKKKSTKKKVVKKKIAKKNIKKIPSKKK